MSLRIHGPAERSNKMMDAELKHYGVKGMKWGQNIFSKEKPKNRGVRRIIRGHGGPGIYIGEKRRLAGARRDLKVLDEGGHLSVGTTKKRQAAYDKRDRKKLNKIIEKAEKKLAKTKIKDLQKQYGELEDKMTYGKKADAKANARIEKQMTKIENEINRLERKK